MANPSPVGFLPRLILVVLMAIFTGCDSTFDPASSLNGVRVLGVQVDSPYAAPGSSITFTMLSYNGSPRALLPDGSRRPLQILWLGGCENPLGDLYFSCYPQLAATLGRADLSSLATLATLPPGTVGFGPTFQRTVSATILDGRAPPGDGALPYGLSHVFYFVCSGTIGPATTTTSGIPLGCFDPETNQPLGAEDYVFGYTPVYSYAAVSNGNPILGPDGSFQDVRGPAPTCSAADPVSTCPTGTRCASTGRCVPVVPHCPDKTFTDCPKYTLLPDIARESAEIDEAARSEKGEPQTESMWVNYYSTYGRIEKPLRLVNDPLTGWNADYGTTWKAPRGPTEVRLWAVVHDNRGGTTWWEQDVVVE